MPKRLTPEDKRVYDAVDERAMRIDPETGEEYRGCESCGHNGSKWKLEHAHIILRSAGGKTTEENVWLGCMKCHKNGDHGDRIVDSGPMWKTGAD